MENIFLEFQKIQEENPDKIFEILEWEIREVLPNEGEEFWKDPINADEKLQRKYIGVAYKDFQEPDEFFSWTYDGDKYRINSYLYTNPYTKEQKLIEYLEEIPQPSEQEIVEKVLQSDEKIPENFSLEDKKIWDIIVEKVYNGNMHAQMATIAKTNIMLIASLIPILGKEKVKEIFASQIQEAIEISKVREQCGIEPFDLSFIE